MIIPIQFSNGIERMFKFTHSRKSDSTANHSLYNPPFTPTLNYESLLSSAFFTSSRQIRFGHKIDSNPITTIHLWHSQPMETIANES